MCVQWAEALQVFMRAADELGLVSRKSLWGQFWSSHQRFFKYLCIAAKVRCLVELARKELDAGKVSANDSSGRSHIICIIQRTIKDPRNIQVGIEIQYSLISEQNGQIGFGTKIKLA